MSEKKIYNSPALESIHDTALGLFNLGIIDRRQMDEFDAACVDNIEAQANQDDE